MSPFPTSQTISSYLYDGENALFSRLRGLKLQTSHAVTQLGLSSRNLASNHFALPENDLSNGRILHIESFC